MRQRTRAIDLEEKLHRLRRVEITEDRQSKTLVAVRLNLGYSEDLDPHAHDQATFRLINERKKLDRLPGAVEVVPMLDDWKFWTKMNDWDSRNQLLEQLIGKLRRKEASQAEIYALVAICRPTWAKVIQSLRRYDGGNSDPGAANSSQREEVARVNELDNDELAQVVQHGLFDAFQSCPAQFPRFFFSWLQASLVHRALDHVRADISEHGFLLPDDSGIKDVLDAVLTDVDSRAADYYQARGAPGYSQWLGTLDLSAVFDVADEYATYTRVDGACRRAVNRLPRRQRQVVQDHYFREMTQEQIAEAEGRTASSIRSSHQGALGNLRKDDELFEVLEAVGKVRDRARKRQLNAMRKIAA